MRKLTIATASGREVNDITEDVRVVASEITHGASGIIYLNVLHTTAAITLGDYDGNGTGLDYLDAFEEMIPKLNYRHPHNPAHMPDHILSTVIGTTLTIPWEKDRLVLGEWQRIILFEFDGPRARNIAITFVSSN